MPYYPPPAALATTNSAGLISASEKTKLNSLVVDEATQLNVSFGNSTFNNLSVAGATIIGAGGNALVDSATCIGSGASVFNGDIAAGSGASVDGARSMAFGSGAAVTLDDCYAFGAGCAPSEIRSTSFAFNNGGASLGTTDPCRLNVLGRTSSTANRKIFEIRTKWDVATDASRRSSFALCAQDASAERVVLSGDSSGSAPRIGVLGATPIARTGAPSIASDLPSVITLGNAARTTLINFGLWS